MAREPYPELDLERARSGFPRIEQGGDGEWHVRPVGPAAKEYLCPGCQHVITLGTAHVVAWRSDSWRGDEAALDDRRHWHAHCWETRHGARREA